MYKKEGAEADDGITTGWICINVGPVEDALVDPAQAHDEDLAERDGEEFEEYVNPEITEEEPEDADYVGFGSRSNAPRIVVQMLTEEKRADLDLEGLWQDRSTRRTRKTEKESRPAKAAMGEQRTDGSTFSWMVSRRQAAPLEQNSAGG